MKYRYLVFSGAGVWGKTPTTLTREYFAAAAQRGDLIIDTQENTYFDAEENAWLPIKGDEL